MRVLLLNDGCFGDAGNVKFPVEVEALRLTDGGHFKISKDELHRVGFVDFNFQSEWLFADGDEAVLVTPTEQTDITNKCCNQFGEREEIQNIINSLQADVVARGARIADLELQIDKLYTLAQDAGVSGEYLRINFACSRGEW